MTPSDTPLLPPGHAPLPVRVRPVRVVRVRAVAVRPVRVVAVRAVSVWLVVVRAVSMKYFLEEPQPASTAHSALPRAEQSAAPPRLLVVSNAVSCSSSFSEG